MKEKMRFYGLVICICATLVVICSLNEFEYVSKLAARPVAFRNDSQSIPYGILSDNSSLFFYQHLNSTKDALRGKRYKQMFELARNMPLFLGAGQSGTGVQAMFHAMCKLGVPSVAYDNVCFTGSIVVLTDPVYNGLKAHKHAMHAWHSFEECAERLHDGLANNSCADFISAVRKHVAEVVTSGIGSVHGAPYNKMLPYILSVRQNKGAGPPIILLSERESSEWAEHVSQNRSDSLELMCSDSSMAFDLDRCIDNAVASSTNGDVLYYTFQQCEVQSSTAVCASLFRDALDIFQAAIRLQNPAFRVNLWEGQWSTPLDRAERLAWTIWNSTKHLLPLDVIAMFEHHADYGGFVPKIMRENEGVSATTTKLSSRFVICTRIRNEAPYLREWIEYHRMIGFDSFLILNTDSSDDSQCVLDSYAREGVVRMIPSYANMPQHSVFNACQKHFSAEEEILSYPATWMLTHDPDEFVWFNQTLFSTFADAVRSAIEGNSITNPIQSLMIPRLLFGSSGLSHFEPEPVMDRFVHRFDPDGCDDYNPHHHRSLFRHDKPHSYCKLASSPIDNVKSMSLVSVISDCSSVRRARGINGEKAKKQCSAGPHVHTLVAADNDESYGAAVRRRLLLEDQHSDDPRYAQASRLLPTIAIMHYMMKSREEFYQRNCKSMFAKKYSMCNNCSPESYFNLTETFANNFKDDRMSSFSIELKSRMAESRTALHCKRVPESHDWAYYHQCWKIL